MPVHPKDLSPTARTLYWYTKYKGREVDEISMEEASTESGIPVSSLYRAARELRIPIARAGSFLVLSEAEIAAEVKRVQQ